MKRVKYLKNVKFNFANDMLLDTLQSLRLADIQIKSYAVKLTPLSSNPKERCKNYDAEIVVFTQERTRY